MIRVNCYFERACRYDESLGACRPSRFYKLCKTHSKASPSTLLNCLFTDVVSFWSRCKTLDVSINEMPVLLFIEISYQIFSIL